MKITRLETIPVRVPIRPELAIRSGRGGWHAESPCLIGKVHADEGRMGLGEVSCTPRWSGEDQVSAAHFISSYFAPLLVGQDPTRVAEVTGEAFRPVAGNAFTKAAVEMALWDLAGKAAGKPVYELLGGKVRDAIPIKMVVGSFEVARARALAEQFLSWGVRALKVKVGLDVDGD